MTKEERKQAFNDVFLSHRWGNPSNAGKHYKRPYNKTKREASKGE